MMSMLSQTVIDLTKDYLRRSCRPGEWQDRSVIVDFLHGELGYAEDTASQYAQRYLKWAVTNRDIERSASGRSWRRIA